MHAHHLCDDFNRAFGTEAAARSNPQSLLAVLRHVRVCSLVTQRRVAPNICRHRSKIAYFAVAPISPSAGLNAQPWKVLANWSWAG
ncbi:hypothetical protein PS3A_02070 [Pseudomonas sp. 3A(2025)]